MHSWDTRWPCDLSFLSTGYCLTHLARDWEWTAAVCYQMGMVCEMKCWQVWNVWVGGPAPSMPAFVALLLLSLSLASSEFLMISWAKEKTPWACFTDESAWYVGYHSKADAIALKPHSRLTTHNNGEGDSLQWADFEQCILLPALLGVGDDQRERPRLTNRQLQMFCVEGTQSEDWWQESLGKRCMDEPLWIFRLWRWFPLWTPTKGHYSKWVRQNDVFCGCQLAAFFFILISFYLFIYFSFIFISWRLITL